jgi:hypothetical protein
MDRRFAVGPSTVVERIARYLPLATGTDRASIVVCWHEGRPLNRQHDLLTLTSLAAPRMAGVLIQKKTRPIVWLIRRTSLRRPQRQPGSWDKRCSLVTGLERGGCQNRTATWSISRLA